MRVNADGSLPGSWLTWSQQGTPSLSTGVLSAAIGQRQDGTPVVAFGLHDGTLRLIDPTASGTTDTLAQSSPGERLHRDQPDPQVRRLVGGSDFAVSYQTTPATSDMVGNGGLLRWDGTSANLTALPVTRRSSPNTVTADWDEFRTVVSGDQAGSFAGHQHVGGAGHGDVAGGVGFVVGLLVCAELGRRAGIPDSRGHRGGRADLSDLHDGRLHGGARRQLRGDQQHRHLAGLSGDHPGQSSG